MYIDPGPQIKGFSVNRPPAMLEFWDALYEVMRQTPTVLFWPGEPGCCVTESYVDLLPADFSEKAGQEPVIVTSGAQISAVIADS
jgi:hypothetical protein